MSAAPPVVEGVGHRWVRLPDGPRLHVAEAGAGSPLVLVHGWPQHWWAWRRVLPGLADWHRVLCPDLRGLGWSDAPPGDYAKERWADDLLALLDALDLDRVALAGHDWGGFVALLAALEAPDRVASVAALSIIHPWPRRPPRRARAARRLAYAALVAAPVAGQRTLRHVPSFVRELIRNGSHPASAWTRPELDAYAQRLREPARAQASSAAYRTFLTRELRALTAGRHAGRRLRVPALMLTGEADPVVRPEAIASLGEYADCARLEVVPRAGHFLPEERPDAVLAALRAHVA